MDLFRAKKQEGRHNLRIGSYFSMVQHEDVIDETALFEEEEIFTMADKPAIGYESLHSRDVS